MVSLLKRERRHFLTMLFDSCIDEKKTLNPRRESPLRLRRISWRKGQKTAK